MATGPRLGDVDLVLASTSRYRAELLRRLTTRLRQLAPDADETALPGEAPFALAQRLAQAKAESVAAHCPGSVIIGSDQVAALGSDLLGKPVTVERAVQQLQSCSGRVVDFHTAICAIDRRTSEARVSNSVDHTRVLFRALTRAEIVRYVEREQPLDCAGSFKCEGLGIGLFERIDNADPSALIGLPLIAVCRLLRGFGLEII
ncbi:MAG: Maf family protein [Tahibacter sp.]